MFKGEVLGSLSEPVPSANGSSWAVLISRKWLASRGEAEAEDLMEEHRPARGRGGKSDPSNLVGGHILGPPVVPFYPFLGEGSPAKIDYRKKGTLILTSLLEDLVYPPHDVRRSPDSPQTIKSRAHFGWPQDGGSFKPAPERVPSLKNQTCPWTWRVAQWGVMLGCRFVGSSR